MNWKFIKAFPKYAIVIGVMIASTVLFALWWKFRQSPMMPQNWAKEAAARKDEIQKKAASLPEKLGSLALVDADLYNIDTGELLFPNWLGGIPQRLFYQPETNRLMAQTERGVIRFALDGTKDGVLGDDLVPAFTHDGKHAMYVRQGNIFTADVDWKAFRLVDERQATRSGQFNAQYFAGNVVLGTEKALVVRNQNQLVRVNLLTGNVQPLQLPLSEIAKRRSPDGRFLIGELQRTIYLFDVEAEDDAHSFPLGSREHVNDFQWLDDNQHCAFIIGGKTVALFDRTKSAIKEVAALPTICTKIAGPSPDGRYALCAGRQGIVIVDFKAKKTEPFGTPAQGFAWVSDDTLIYSRDVQDTSTRGTWLKTMGGEERQFSGDPYAIGRDGSGAMGLIEESKLVVFAGRAALYRIKSDGADLRELTKLAKHVEAVQAVEIWGK